MFRFLGAAIRDTWFLWLIAWVSLFALVYWTAPPWEQVARDREFAFLPEDSPSRQGLALFKQAFPNDKEASNVVIIVSRANEKLGDQDRAFIKNVVRPALMKLVDQEGSLPSTDGSTPKTSRRGRRTPIIAGIRTLNDPGWGDLLVSADHQATLVMVQLTTELLEQRNWPIVHKIETLIADWRSQEQVPTGLNLDLFGSAVVGRDLTRGQQETAEAIQFWSVVIVIAILVLIYRAPLLAMIPLLSVYMATQIAMKLLSYLAEADLITLFGGVEIYITVILYGTGVDYCLFLIARYEEQLEKGMNSGDALANSVCHIGPALAASAATVMFGIGMMVFARFGKFHYAGIAVAFSLAVSLCVILTFATSLLRLMGRWAFWPRVLKAAPEVAADSAPPRWWGWLSWNGVGRALLRWPATIWFITVLVMSPLAIGGLLYSDDVDYDFVRRLPADAPSSAGDNALQEHFPAGTAGTLTVLIYHPHLDFRPDPGQGRAEIDALTAQLQERLDPLQLAEVRSVSQPLGTGWAARKAMQRALKLPVDEAARDLEKARDYYVSNAGNFRGHVTRMELTMLQNPLSRPGIASLNHIEQTIRSHLSGELRNAEIFMLGTTADMRDLRRVTSSDQIRIQILVILCVLAILIVLLRRVAVAVYLIASVLFSYFATLGATLVFFWWWEGDGFVGLDWKVPIFLFTILVAIGEDYNIFLMTRVAEEQARHGAIEGIHIAMVKTGRIITSCGIIMAGTFASLLLGSMQDLHHLGFALAFGVMVDTFVVRPILAPAFLVVLERGRVLWRKLSIVLETKKEPEEKSV